MVNLKPVDDFSNSDTLELKKLVDICHHNLSNSKECISYLKRRGLSDSIISKYKLGYFPRSPSVLSNYVSDTLLQRLSIVEYSGSSKFSEYFYLIFPIFSEYNDPVGIGGRALISEDSREILNIPKYKNSSYKKSNYLYGLNNSRSAIFKSQNAYVVEGYFDQISLTANGVSNSVAICGTSFSKNHLLKLSRYTNKLTFILDTDSAGISAMERIKDKYIGHGVDLEFMSIPNKYKDIDEYFLDGNSKDDLKNDLKEFVFGWQ